MKHGDAFAERRLEPARRLRREGDLRHEHDRAIAPRQHAHDRLDVNERLSAAGHALQQELGERAAVDRARDGVDRTLLFGRGHESAAAAQPAFRGNRAPLRFHERALADGARDDGVREPGEHRVCAA